MAITSGNLHLRRLLGGDGDGESGHDTSDGDHGGGRPYRSRPSDLIPIG